ncbi:MAG: hypothetical protein KDE22_12685 [Rhodobacterales bacterium]|nr:hypothetical protein [Rhodobacterales bacterium]
MTANHHRRRPAVTPPGAAFAAALACVLALGACQTTAPLNADTFTKDGFMSGTEMTQDYCESLSDSIWVVVEGEGDCVRYYAGGLEDENDIAVANFYGDFGGIYFKSRKVHNANSLWKTSAEKQKSIAVKTAKKYGVPFIIMARPGTLGASGSQGEKWSKRNSLVMDAGLTAIAKRHHIKAYALSSQSGGGLIIGALLPWRNDIRCAVMASTAVSIIEVLKANYIGYNVDSARPYIYDPYDHVDEISPDSNRRVFVLADKEDGRTIFWTQKSYIDKLAANGHDAHLIDLTDKGSGRFSHGLQRQAVLGAAECAKGKTDAEIEAAVLAFKQ